MAANFLEHVLGCLYRKGVAIHAFLIMCLVCSLPTNLLTDGDLNRSDLNHCEEDFSRASTRKICPKWGHEKATKKVQTLCFQADEGHEKVTSTNVTSNEKSSELRCQLRLLPSFSTDSGPIWLWFGCCSAIFKSRDLNAISIQGKILHPLPPPPDLGRRHF